MQTLQWSVDLPKIEFSWFYCVKKGTNIYQSPVMPSHYSWPMRSPPRTNGRNIRLNYPALYVQKVSYTFNFVLHNIWCQTVIHPYPFSVFIYVIELSWQYMPAPGYLYHFIWLSHTFMWCFYWPNCMWCFIDQTACGMSLDQSRPQSLHWCITQN